MNRLPLLYLLGTVGIAMTYAVAAWTNPTIHVDSEKPIMLQTDSGLLDPLPQTEAEWKKVLTPEQFDVLRRKGTERAFTGKYANSKQQGVYRCAGCGQTLFSSEHKYDSGTGWPSFWQPIDDDHIALHADNGFFMRRTEVVCSRCDGHLGHVFNDGPLPTGRRYCMNSAALKLDETS